VSNIRNKINGANPAEAETFAAGQGLAYTFLRTLIELLEK